jgi:hypothetical protein
MSASFSWVQSVGAVPNHTPLGASGNLVNFKNVDTIGTSDYAAHPIPAGNPSFEVWLQGKFDGLFTAIYDLRFWMSTNFISATGLTVKAKTNQVAYNAPTNATSSYAVTTLGTSDPGTANVSVGGSLTSSLTSSGGYTDYIVLQLQTTAAATAGDTSQATFSMSYIES